MNSAGRTTLTWIGRLFLLTVPVVIFGGFFYPKGIQFLDPVACGSGLSLDIDTNDPDTPFDNRAICVSDTLLVEATDRVLAIAAASFVIAVGAYALRSRITPRSLSAPNTPQHV